ncbi:MAG TPA: FUSC family protein [Acidimicrobiales bacterium]|nr:FUSC family protein [Acidimicrobiales bacterium]
MVAPAAASSAPLVNWGDRVTSFLSSLRPSWSRVAALRALRATLVVPTLFALSVKVVGNLQMASFAAFGGFATLLLANFGGTRRDKLFAHSVLAVLGGAFVVLGTAVSSSWPLAAGAGAAVAFLVLFAGIGGPNAASGATAVLLAYVLPAASVGTMSMLPAREAGWWMASVAGTAAVLWLSPRPAGDRVRTAAGACAAALAQQLDAALAGTTSSAESEKSLAATQSLVAAFAAAPYRPTGLAVPDQALGALVEALEWGTSVVGDALKEGADLKKATPVDRSLLAAASAVLSQTALLLSGEQATPLLKDLEEMERESASALGAISTEGPDGEAAIHFSFHARMVASAARSAAIDALLASRKLEPAAAAVERARWHGAPPDEAALSSPRDLVATFRRIAGGNANVRSVWFLNSARGAVALGTAVAVADLTNVQHGFWVVLGALSVLRTNAASTGAIALRALVGTAVGFFIGAGLLAAVGGGTAALWVAFPLAILVAAYAPGTAPFAVGQAAFTVAITVLINILAPVGWKVGAVRLEDVALGAAVSVVAGILFWPRGAARVFRDDLAEAFHSGGVYLVQATAWALGSRPAPPEAGGKAFEASLRLDDALRALQAEQGTKRLSKQEVSSLVGGAMRVRLTAQSLASVASPAPAPGPEKRSLLEESVVVAGACDELAERVGRTAPTAARELAVVLSEDSDVVTPNESPYGLWAHEHLRHIRFYLAALEGPVAAVETNRHSPWWR